MCESRQSIRDPRPKGFRSQAEISPKRPADRIGHQELILSELQILQVGRSLVFSVPFSIAVVGTPIKLDYVWASLWLVGAAYFKSPGQG